MKRFATLVFAGALAWSGLPGVLDAQAVPEERTLLYAIGLIEQADVHAAAIAALTEVPRVEVVNIAILAGPGASRHVFEETMAEYTLRNRDEVAMLRHAMTGNGAVVEALADAGVEPSRIVAAEIRTDLALRVYVGDW